MLIVGTIIIAPFGMANAQTNTERITTMQGTVAEILDAVGAIPAAIAEIQTQVLLQLDTISDKLDALLARPMPDPAPTIQEITAVVHNAVDTIDIDVQDAVTIQDIRAGTAAELAELTASVAVLQTTQSTQSDQLDAIQAELKTQRALLEALAAEPRPTPTIQPTPTVQPAPVVKTPTPNGHLVGGISKFTMTGQTIQDIGVQRDSFWYAVLYMTCDTDVFIHSEDVEAHPAPISNVAEAGQGFYRYVEDLSRPVDHTQYVNDITHSQTLLQTIYPISSDENVLLDRVYIHTTQPVLRVGDKLEFEVKILDHGNGTHFSVYPLYAGNILTMSVTYNSQYTDTVCQWNGGTSATPVVGDGVHTTSFALPGTGGNLLQDYTYNMQCTEPITITGITKQVADSTYYNLAGYVSMNVNGTAIQFAEDSTTGIGTMTNEDAITLAAGVIPITGRTLDGVIAQLTYNSAAACQ